MVEFSRVQCLHQHVFQLTPATSYFTIGMAESEDWWNLEDSTFNSNQTFSQRHTQFFIPTPYQKFLSKLTRWNSRLSAKAATSVPPPHKIPWHCFCVVELGATGCNGANGAYAISLNENSRHWSCPCGLQKVVLAGRNMLRREPLCWFPTHSSGAKFVLNYCNIQLQICSHCNHIHYIHY